MENGTTTKEDWGCPSCLPPTAEEAWQATRTLTRKQVLIDESHFLVDIRACPSCGQQFLWVMTELIDWQDGEDPIERTILPLTSEEADELSGMNEANLTGDYLNTLGTGRRCLRYSWPKGVEKQVFWSTGLLVGPHD